MLAIMLFGKELTNGTAIFVYVLMAAAFVLLVASIAYYWYCTKVLQRMIDTDNRNNNMLRQELLDSFVEGGESEWPCSICFHDNHPRKKECVMCGTPQVVSSKPEDGSNDEHLRPRISGLRRGDLSFMTGAHGGLCKTKSSVLDQQSRVRSFHVRRLKQMNLTSRQKAAIRRHIWRRKKGPDGNLHWVRIDDNNAQATKSRQSSLSMHTPKDSFPDVSLTIDEDFEYQDSFNDDSFPQTQPLRATALRALEASQLQQSFIEGDDSGRGRMNNFTTISTGYVRHDDGDGNIDWAPAVAVAINKEEENECDIDLEEIAALTFKEKNNWFLEEVQKRWVPWEKAHVQFVVRREHVLADSLEQVMKCPVPRFWERMRVYFEGEPGLDAGGLIREWYEIMNDVLFDESLGLFIATKGDTMGYWINSSSGDVNPDHLLHFEFVGRLLGKALVEGQLFKVSLALPLLKHMLGVPISFSDLEFLDNELHKNCRWIKKNDGVVNLSLDFTVQVKDKSGKARSVELKPDGANIEVTDENKREYLECLLRYYMFDSISEQVTAFLKGLYDIVPKYLLSVFDYQELDLLISGVPDIDVEDWKSHSEVKWMKFEKPSNQERDNVQWFWEVVHGFTAEQKARLLQFVTGTSRVPVQGFKALTSSDGRVRRFSLHLVPCGAPPAGLMPKAHTCFNRMDLPLYGSKQDLTNYLTLVINMEITGFWLE